MFSSPENPCTLLFCHRGRSEAPAEREGKDPTTVTFCEELEGFFSANRG